MARAEQLYAGSARVDVTPAMDIPLSGEVGWFRPGQSVSDPLYASVLILKHESKKLCFITLDITIITEDWSEQIRNEASRLFGFDPQSVMVHATQVHTAPSMGRFLIDKDFTLPADMEWIGGGDPRYGAFAFDLIINAIGLAHEQLQPASVCVGSGIEGRVQFNRRAITNDGTVRMPGPSWPAPLGPTYIRYMEGPIDPEVGVICIQNKAEKVLSLMLHYTGHPVNVFPKPVISSDWPGTWCQEMRNRLGHDCIPLVINGCCGNINPWDPFDPNYVPDHRRMGRILAETTNKILENTEIEEDISLDYRVRHIKLPIKDVEPDMLDEAQKMLSKNPEPIWNQEQAHVGYEAGQADLDLKDIKIVDQNWMRAATVMSVHLLKQRQAEFDYEIQAFKIGRTAVIGLPGEPFVEGQLQIKMSSPAYRTYIAHCSNMGCGYIPTKEAFPRGGHEVRTTYWAKFAPEALDIVVDASADLLKDMF